MRKTILLFAILGVACGSQPAEKTGESGAVSPKVQKAATIADAIKAEPDRAEQILAEHDMTAQSFADLMYEIAADETLSAQFQKARRR